MKKKILFFGKVPPPYIGPAVATEIILNSKLKNLYDLEHFDISHHNNMEDFLKFSFKKIVFSIKKYFELIIVIIKKNPDIVYIPSMQNTIGFLRDLPFIFISKIFRKKLVLHLRGGFFKNWYNNECNGLMKIIIRFAYRFVDAQIVLGDNLVGLFSDVLPSKKVYVIPNAGNFNSPKIPSKDDSSKITFLFLGNIIKSKGVCDFLNSTKFLNNDEIQKSKFIICGHKRDEDTINEIYDFIKLNPDINLEYLGPVSGEDKMDVFAMSDVFVFPSYYRNEGHPWVIVEALASKLPIISTNHAAISESVIDSFNGFLVKKNDPSSIAEKIKIFIDNEKTISKMSVNSGKLYKEKFTEDCLVKNFDKVFKSVLLQT